MLSTPFLRAGLAALFLLCLIGPFSALAQTLDDTTFQRWDSVVARVDRVLAQGEATEATLERLRATVVEYRDTFISAENANSDLVARTQRQLAALGPAPAEGATEPDDVAARRAALNAQIAALRAPALRASEAFAEADAVVREIDGALRARQAARALERFPLPVNPLNWQAPLDVLRGIALAVPTEIIARLGDPEQRDKILYNLPSAALSLIGGAFLVFRSRHWTKRIAGKVDTIRKPLLRSLAQLVSVVAQLALPWAGLSLLVGALQLTGIFGPTGESVLLAVVAFGFAMIAATWLVEQLFPRRDGAGTPLVVAPRLFTKARRTAYAMAVLMSVYQGLAVLNQRLGFDQQSAVYIAFALSLLVGATVFRMASLMRRSASGQSVEGGEDTERAFTATVITVLTTLAMIATVGALLAGLAGYLVLTREIVYPLAGTFFLYGFVALVQRGFADFYAVLRKRSRPGGDDAPEAPDEGLVPTLIGVLLFLAALPALALLWGARVTDLSELWAQIRAGFTIGEVRISPTESFLFLLVFVFGYTLTRLVQGVLRNSILPKTRLDIGGRTAIVSGIGYVGIFLAAIAAITTAGINLSSFAIFASALAVGIGFGLQTIVSNFVSGIILLIERPIAEGDWIEVGGVMGHVRSISVRATKIETFDRTSVIVPNADFVSGVVTNWTRGNSVGRVIVPVGVAYGTDTRKVEQVLTEIANAHPIVVISPPPSVLFMGFGADSLDFEIRAIVRDVNFSLSVRSDLNHEIARRFTEEGIEIPFAQRDLWLRNPETLRPVSRSDGSAAHAQTPPQPDRDPDMEAEGDSDAT